MKNDKLQIVYIASNGRSGSTVLDLLLGAHASFWTLGEFFVLPWEIRSNTKPCGCGVPVTECKFWGPIIEKHRQVLLNGTIHRFRESYWSDHMVHFAELPFLSSRSAKHRTARLSDLEQYGRDNEQLFHSVLDGARAVKGGQVCWLVDSSKSSYRLLWLQESKRFDIRVIHLVKDPRAFSFSVCKKTAGFVRAKQLGKAVMRWNVENLVFERLFQAHFSPDQVFRLRYEDLATDPQAALQHISGWLNVPYDDALSERFRNENHGIAGNPSRFDKAGIRLDEEWRRGFMDGTKRLLWAASFPMARRYGYAL
jgi:hypothetical protein